MSKSRANSEGTRTGYRLWTGQQEREAVEQAAAATVRGDRRPRHLGQRGAQSGLSVALAMPSLFTLYQQPPRLESALVLDISPACPSTRGAIHSNAQPAYLSGREVDWAALAEGRRTPEPIPVTHPALFARLHGAIHRRRVMASRPTGRS